MADSPADLFGDSVVLAPALIPDEPLPDGGIEALPNIVKEALEAAQGEDDLFGDGDADDNASVATEQLEQGDGLTETELAARRALEYTEEDAEQLYGQQITQTEEATASLDLEKLPVPSSADGNLWHIKLPTFLRFDDTEFDEQSYEEPAEDAEDFPEENMIRWRRGQSGGDSRNSNARIVRWSDGSQSLQVGDEFFDVLTTSSNPLVKAEEGGSSTSAGLTLVVGQHPDSSLLEASGVVTGSMSFTPYNVSSVAHRRLANNMADQHVTTNRTIQLKLEQDPELERMAREKAESERLKAARKERAKAAGPRRKRRGLRSMRIDRSDDEEGEALDYSDSGDEDATGGSRRTRPSYLDGPDEDDERFIVESDPEGGAEERGEDDDIDRMEKDAERANRGQRRMDKRPSDNRMDVDPPPRRDEPREETTFVRRKLVVGGDSDED